MMFGYVLNHNGDCYMMWNPKINYVQESRYVIWLQIKYFAKKSVIPEQATATHVSLNVYREPETDIIEVRQVNDDGYSADSSEEKFNYYYEKMKQMMHHILLQQCNEELCRDLNY